MNDCLLKQFDINENNLLNRNIKNMEFKKYSTYFKSVSVTIIQ